MKKSGESKRNISKKQHFLFGALILDILFMTFISLGYKNANYVFLNGDNSFTNAQIDVVYASNNCHLNVLETESTDFGAVSSNINFSALESNVDYQESAVEKEVTVPPERNVTSEMVAQKLLSSEDICSVFEPISTESVVKGNNVVNKTFYNDYVEPFLAQDTLSCFHSRLEINRSKAYPFEINSENQTIGHSIQVIDGVTYIDGILIVNKTYSLPESYHPGALYPEVLSSFDAMKSAAQSVGLNIYIASGFRSYGRQVYLYNHYVNRDGQTQAERFSARPGHSEHQSGYSFDLNTITDKQGTTAESVWVAEHAHEYGFIVRFPAGKEEYTGYLYEPWHLRYVGIELATYLYENNLCLEEYFDIPSEYED
ncbi:MAG: D-alanyl-D-alanine carboxypeptidase family protein [Lachnospiraceae bacterium]